MTPFLDLHTHLLPGVDDGPGTVDEAVALLRLAHAAGTRGMVATPHMFAPSFDNFSPARIRQAFADFTGALDLLASRDPELSFLADLELSLGAENFCSPEFLAALDDGAVLSLNDGRHLLVELPPYLPFGAIEAAMRRILRAGYFPVLAHVERYPELLKDTERIRGLLAIGCRIQINASSLLGGRLSRSRRAVLRLLKAGHVDVVASDAHNTTSRHPRLDEAHRALGARFGAERAEEWTSANPRSLIDG